MNPDPLSAAVAVLVTITLGVSGWAAHTITKLQRKIAKLEARVKVLMKETL